MSKDSNLVFLKLRNLRDGPNDSGWPRWAGILSAVAIAVMAVYFWFAW